MKTLLFIIIQGSFLGLMAQKNEVVLHALENKTFAQIQKLNKKGTNEGFTLLDFNDLIGNYHGGRLVVYNSSEESWSKHTVWIQVICYNNQIIYYDFSEEVHFISKKNTAFSRAFETIPSLFIDSLHMSKIESLFSATYNRPLNLTAFFDRPTFGYACDEGAVNPKEMDLVLSYVQENNRSGIEDMLCSSNTTIQVYGLYALFKLEQLEIDLTTREIKLRKEITKKSGFIENCGGCLYGSEKIKDVIASFPQVEY